MSATIGQVSLCQIDIARTYTSFLVDFRKTPYSGVEASMRIQKGPEVVAYRVYEWFEWIGLSAAVQMGRERCRKNEKMVGRRKTRWVTRDYHDAISAGNVQNAPAAGHAPSGLGSTGHSSSHCKVSKLTAGSGSNVMMLQVIEINLEANLKPTRSSTKAQQCGLVQPSRLLEERELPSNALALLVIQFRSHYLK